MALSPNQIADLALSEGLTPQEAVTAVAVAEAESGGNPSAQGDIGLENATWGPSVGLWQVRTLKNPGSTWYRDVSKVSTPQGNADAMKAISGGGANWQPWSTYIHGQYTAFLPEAQAAVSQEKQNGNYNALAQQIGPGSSGSVTAVPVSLGGDIEKGLGGFFNGFPIITQLNDVGGALAEIVSLLQWWSTHLPEVFIRAIELFIGLSLVYFASIAVIVILAASATPDSLKDATFFGIGLAFPETKIASAIGVSGIGRSGATNRGSRTRAALDEAPRAARRRTHTRSSGSSMPRNFGTGE